MNVKSPAKLSIDNWLKRAVQSLNNVGIESSKLDAELILLSIFNKNRSYLHAHGDYELSKNELKKVNKMLKKRLQRYPLAYISGKKEFYGRDFIVNKNVLIPRPESEGIIDTLKRKTESLTNKNLKIIDVGCGSGCLGITAKLEIPQAQVLLIDNSKKAIKIAKQNALNLKSKVEFVHSNLLSKQKSNSINIVIANLPYLDKNWPRSLETQYEPHEALFAKDKGTNLIKKLIKQSFDVIKQNGYLILEFEPAQLPMIIEYAKHIGFNYVESIDYITVFTKN